jgi:hypothetical protein
MINADGEIDTVRNADGDKLTGEDLMRALGVKKPPHIIPFNRVFVEEKNGKYYLDGVGIELDPNKLEEWGSILLSKLAKNLLRRE